MSKTFPARPGVSRTGDRGRYRGNEVRPQPINQPKEDRGVPAGRGGTGRGSGVGRTAGRGSRMYQPHLSGVRGGRGAGRGREMGPNYDQQNTGEDGDTDNTKGDSLQQRAAHMSGYTVISPNEKKRRQLSEQAEKETRAYEQYKQQNKPTRVSYVGTVGGGETLSMAEARQQQIRGQPTKASRLIREQERRETQKQAEEREYVEKKMNARRKAEEKEQKDRERQQTWQSDMRRVNQAFLDKLEAQNKGATSGGPSQTKLSPDKHQSRQVSHASHAQSPAACGDQTGATSVSPSTTSSTSRRNADSLGAGTVPKLRQPQYNPGVPDTTTTDRESWHVRRSPTHPCDVPGSTAHDAQFYTSLDLLQSMFPDYTEAALVSILEESNGSVDDALHLLGV